MKLFYLFLILAVFSCESNTSQQEEILVECPLFDSIHFERPIFLDDPDLEQFLRPIHWIDSIILANKILPDTLIRTMVFDTLYKEFWTFNQQLIKMQERRVDFLYNPGYESVLSFYTLNDCNWYHSMEKRCVQTDSLISIQILNFNNNNYVNYIYALGPEPIRVFTSKSPKTYPIIDVEQLANYYYGLQNEIAYFKAQP